jgi:LysM repeat protein/uncharacterized C2H2 Zn-finger protein
MSTETEIKLDQSLLAAFERVVDSTHPNLFQEAAAYRPIRGKDGDEVVGLPKPDKLTGPGKDYSQNIKSSETAGQMFKRLADDKPQTQFPGKEKDDKIVPSPEKLIKPAEFTFNSKGGNVSADELNSYRKFANNPNVTLGQYMNARDKLTAIKGGKNDPSVIQKKLGVGQTAYEPGKLSETFLNTFNSVINSEHSNIFAEAAKKNAKKLDPVGREDEDIDNDGDKDKADSYLHNRRKAVAKAMKEEDASLFSVEELAFLEAMAVAPTPEDQAPNPSPKNKAEGGKGKGSLSEQSKYKIKKGDTLWDLSKKYGTTVDAISKASGIKDPNKLKIGQELVIPGSDKIAPIPLPRPANRMPSGETTDLKKDDSKVKISPSVTGGIGVSGKATTDISPKINTKQNADASAGVSGSAKSQISIDNVSDQDKYLQDRLSQAKDEEKAAMIKADKFVKKPDAFNLPFDNQLNKIDLGAYGRKKKESTMKEEQITEARGRPPKEASLGANELHMNAKRAADNMANITHKFANGERVKMTKGMGVAFLNRHSAARTSDDKDALLNYAHQSPETFENVSRGGNIPKTEKAGIKLGSMKAK